MHWTFEVRERMERRNQVLFSVSGLFLLELSQKMQLVGRQAMVLWALEMADETAALLARRYPNESRPRDAAKISRAWAAGKIKMPDARRAILAAHAVAKEIESPEDIALCHAVGQACAVVHTPRHAIGFPAYELTALVHRHGIDTCVSPIEARRRQYLERMDWWERNYHRYPGEWAVFLREK